MDKDSDSQKEIVLPKPDQIIEDTEIQKNWKVWSWQRQNWKI